MQVSSTTNGDQDHRLDDGPPQNKLNLKKKLSIFGNLTYNVYLTEVLDASTNRVLTQVGLF